MSSTPHNTKSTTVPGRYGPGIWSSWNGNLTHSYDRLFVPESEEQLVEAVRYGDRVRVTGNNQSSADIAAGTDTLIDIKRYNRVVSEESERRRITVQSGMSLKQLMQELEARGLTLPCLPDIDTITVGGALATGTHGTSGDGHILAEYMVACRLVTADGSVKQYDSESTPQMMQALRCSLGLFGVFSTITFEAHPLYRLKIVEKPMKDKVWTANFRQWLEDYEFVRVLWLPHTNYGYVILGERIGDTEQVEEQTAPKYHRHRREVSKFLYARTVRHPRFTRIANKILRRLFFNKTIVTSGSLYGATVTKKRGSTLELGEWSVAMDRFDALFTELKTKLESRHNNAYAHIPMDVRFLRGDSTWLSQAEGQDTVTVGIVTRNAEFADEYKAFDLVEDIFLRYDGRPHWAKRFKAGPDELSRVWPRFNDFVKLRRNMDPEGRFLNPYLARMFG